MNLYFLSLCNQSTKREQVKEGRLPNGKLQGYHSCDYILNPNGKLYQTSDVWKPCDSTLKNGIPLFFRNGLKHGPFYVEERLIIYNRKRASPFLSGYSLTRVYSFETGSSFSSKGFDFLLRVLIRVGISEERRDWLIRIRR
jgi:hypothetical protein